MRNILSTLLLFTTLSSSSLLGYANCNPSCDPCLGHSFGCPIHLDMRGDFDFESRFIYRGSKLAKEVATANFELAYPFCIYDQDFSIYGGAWGIFPVRNSENAAAQQVNVFLGLNWFLDELVSVDLGYIRYNFTNTDLVISDSSLFPDVLNRNFRNRYSSHQNELYFGANFNTYLYPSLYFFFNFELDQWVFEPSLKHSFELTNFCRHCITLDLNLKAGWLHAKTFNGNQRPSNKKEHQNSYFYAQISADFTLHVSDNLSISVGPRYLANNDGSQKGVTNSGDLLTFGANALDGDCDTFWWGAHLKFDF